MLSAPAPVREDGETHMREMGPGLDKIYIEKNQKKLACGYTTGSCAAAAAKGAALLLRTGRVPEEISLDTPKGIRLRLRPEFCRRQGGTAVCGVRKEAGDDPDVTDGVLVCASVSRTEGEEIEVDGGPGIGRVTRPGLEQPVGAAAINAVPRRMIREAVEEVFEEGEGLRILVSIPGGEELAQRTFNPRLGIEGGLSILGTSGIVEPMSEKALVDTIRAEMQVRAAEGEHTLLVTPGNYGADYIREQMDLDLGRAVMCSNYIGETIDRAVELGFSGFILIGHIGKLVKVAGGIMNTHSRAADCRMEILAAHSILAGADAQTARGILACTTTEAALDVMEEAGVRPKAMESLVQAIAASCERRAGRKMEFGILVFSRGKGELGRTENLGRMLADCRRGGE